jgi:hypothetical protein
MASKQAQANAKRQSTYRSRLRKKGLCLRCRAKTKNGKCLCDACTIERREYSRVKHGSKPWQKGRPGRPPKIKIRAKRKPA